jgi:hypothetical protein
VYRVVGDDAGRIVKATQTSVSPAKDERLEQVGEVLAEISRVRLL